MKTFTQKLIILIVVLICSSVNAQDCPFELSLITTYAGDYDSEIGLSITSSTNELVFGLTQGYQEYDGFGTTDTIEDVSTYYAGDFNICLDPQECYTIKMTDYYGDGWNGAYFTIDDEIFSLPR